MAYTILFADDSKTLHNVAEIVFDKEPDYTLHKVVDGNAAVAQAKQLKPTVVVADHSMPGKDGYEVAEALKADPDTAAIPVLILSGSSAPFDEARATNAGAQHLQKPFDCASLFAKVARLCGEDVAEPANPLAHLKPAGSGPPAPSATPPMSEAPAAAPVSPPVAPVSPPVAPSSPPVAPSSPPVAPSSPPVAPTPAAAPVAAAPVAAAPAPVAPKPAAPATAPADLASAVAAQAQAAVVAQAAPAIAASGANGQTASVDAATREIIEKVVWEVVPELAETLIKEEIARLLGDR